MPKDKWRLVYDDGISLESVKEFNTKKELVEFAKQVDTFGLSIYEAIKPNGETFNPDEIIPRITKIRQPIGMRR